MKPMLAMLAATITLSACDGAAPAQGSAAETTSREIKAQLVCIKALKRGSKNPSGIEIPYTTNVSTSGGYIFKWDLGGGLTMQNGAGAKIDAQATCVVAEDGATVIELIVDGKKRIYNPLGRKK